MEYLIVLLFFYLQCFMPYVFSFRAVFLLFSLVLLLFFRHREKTALHVLFLVLLFSLFSRAGNLSDMYIPIDTKEISGLYGTVVTEPVRKKNRYTGYSVALCCVRNERGDYFSSSGKVYVVGPDNAATRGDEVFVEGRMEENFFLSGGGTVISSSVSGKLRRKVNALFISGLPEGETGNIISLLLSGTTLDGSDALQQKVRNLGLSHLISLSGMHLAFLTAIIMPFLSVFLSRRNARKARFVILALFVYLAGMRPSLVRSFLFAVLIPFFGMEASFVFSLVFLSLFFPYYTGELSTVLSFTSLSGVLLLSSLSLPFSEKGSPLLSSIITGIAATAASAPVVYSFFGSWQPYAFLFSIIGTPLVTIIFYLSILHFIIPESDAIIEFFLECLDKASLLSSFLPLCMSFGPYYPILALFLLVIAAGTVRRTRL